MADGVPCEENVRAVSIVYIMLTHHLAEHNEHVRSRHWQPQGAGGRVHPIWGGHLAISTEGAVNVSQ